MLPRTPWRARARAILAAAMLDLKFVVENREAVLAMLASRGQDLAQVQAFPGLDGVDPWALDAERRALIQEVEQLRHRQRTVGEEIARRGKAKEDASELKAEMKGVSERIKQGDARLEEVKAAIERFLMVVPNLPDASVPSGIMERESFSQPEIAHQLNEGFVCVKVDREERPDVDEIYMAATQLITRSGGWPNSVFLTPDLKPFFAGTYFPPDGRPGPPRLPARPAGLREAWLFRRAELLQQAELVARGDGPAPRARAGPGPGPARRRGRDGASGRASPPASTPSGAASGRPPSSPRRRTSSSSSSARATTRRAGCW